MNDNPEEPEDKAEEVDFEGLRRTGDTEPQPEADFQGLAPYHPLRRYLLEIGRFSLLSREEEHRLAVLYHEKGDHEAAYRLVTSNLRLVVKIAMMYHKVYRNLLDLIQEGNLGLIHAVRRFDPHRGTRLPTYAAWWIKAYILKFLLDNSRMVKVGTTNTRRKVLMNLNREKRELEARGIIPTAQLLAHNLGVEEIDVLEVEQAMLGGDVSLDAPLGEGDREIRLKDTLQAMEESVDDKIAQGEFRHILEQKFAELAEVLSERERVILNRRLIADEPDTLQQIADLYGITREAVRVAEKKLIAKIKKFMIESFKDVREIEFNLGR